MRVNALSSSLQEDSSDLKCQLHFAKEESALMCKKLTKLVKDSEAMKEELAKYRSLYGDVNASLTVEEVSSSIFAPFSGLVNILPHSFFAFPVQQVADSPHTREAEIRVHLKLVEEEANLLSRRIVELEVENRGLRAEMEDMKAPQGETLLVSQLIFLLFHLIYFRLIHSSNYLGCRWSSGTLRGWRLSWRWCCRGARGRSFF